MTVEESLALAEGLARIATQYRLDALQVGSVRLVKSFHESAEPTAKRQVPEFPEDADEDLLFHSAGG